MTYTWTIDIIFNDAYTQETLNNHKYVFYHNSYTPFNFYVYISSQSVDISNDKKVAAFQSE